MFRRPEVFPAASRRCPGARPRSAAVLREIVEQYVETGEPVGSRTLSRRLPLNLSPATIRNVMADLTETGLLYAPHTSAGGCRPTSGCGCSSTDCCNSASSATTNAARSRPRWRRRAVAWRTRCPTQARCCPAWPAPPAWCWRRSPKAPCATSNSSPLARVARWWCWWRRTGMSRTG